jgi:hypothetical protein
LHEGNGGSALVRAGSWHGLHRREHARNAVLYEEKEQEMPTKASGQRKGTGRLFSTNKGPGDRPRPVPRDQAGVLTSRLGLEFDGHWVPMAAIYDDRVTFLYAGALAIRQATLLFRNIKEITLEKKAALVPLLPRSYALKILTHDDEEYVVALSSDKDEAARIYHAIRGCL